MLAPFFNRYTIMTEQELFFRTLQSGNLDNLNAQLERNPDLANITDSRGFTPLIFATYFNNAAATEMLLQHGAKVDAQDASGNTALLGVCFKGNTELAALLLKHKANINAQNKMGTTPLIFAVSYDQKAIVELLLANGADKTIKDHSGKTALEHAEEKGLTHLSELL